MSVLNGNTRWSAHLVGIVISGAFIWLLLRRLDITTAGSIVRSVSLPGLFVATAFLASGYTLRVIRWWWILRELNPALPLRKCFGPFLASFALNNLLPFRAGDLVRCLAFREQFQLPPVSLFGSVVLERLFDLTTVLLCLVVGYLGIAGSLAPAALLWTGAGLAGVGLALFGWALQCVGALSANVLRWAQWSPLQKRGWSSRLVHVSRHFAATFALLRRPGMILQISVLSAGIWLLEGGVFISVAHALSIEMPAAGSLYALGLGTLATLLPSTPGALGTFDYGTMQGAITSGANQETAVVFALAVHLMLWLPVSVIGLMFLSAAPAWGRAYRDRSLTTADEELRSGN